MKRKTLMILSLMMLFFVSCLPAPTETTAEQSTTTTTNTGGDTSGDTNTDTNTDTGGGTTGGNGATCFGSTQDGQGNGYPIHHFNLFLAGHKAWVPGTYSSSLAQQTMITALEAAILFPSDTKMRVRFKVKSQPYPTAGQEYCYGRATGQASDQHVYTKLRFKVHLRDVYCYNYNSDGQCTSAGIGPRYRTQFIDPVDVNSCSSVMDFGHLRNSGGNIIATTVEVEDVKADSTCQANGTFCPAEKIVRQASCWQMVMQVVTDYTQDFK